jgi:predicted MFS family arabinose efflux permease
MVFLLASACGLIVANLYYAQPLISLISGEIGLDKTAASLIVTLTQCGYCAGLVLLVPLGDLVENRGLICWTLSGVIIALIAATMAHSATQFLAAALFIGLCAVAVQMLVPIAAHMTPEANRGHVVGKVMSGLLLGIMLARPTSSMLASIFGWRAVFGISAGVMIALLIVLRSALPQRKPQSTHSYGSLLGSMWALLKDTPALRLRAAYQAAMFGAFSLYWTAVPLVLSSQYGLTQRGIALFALIGAAGAFAAPVAGRLADRGLTRPATGLSLALAAASFLLARLGSHGSLIALLASGVLLDLGVQSNLVLGQRTIFALGAHVRSRLNGLYMAMFFAGGALGSSVASVTFARGGWEAVSWVGFAFPAVALVLFATEIARPAPVLANQ